MTLVALVIGILLIMLGVMSYALSGGESLTALIPSAFGIIFTALGLAARKESARKHAMHLLVGLAMVGFLGVAVRVFALATMPGGGAVEYPWAVIAQVIMAVLCLILVAFGIRSFVKARRKKTE